MLYRLFLSLIITLASLQTAVAQRATKTKVAANETNAQTDSQQIRATIIRFYDWYAAHHTKVASFNIWRRKRNGDGSRADHNVLHNLHRYLRRAAPELGSDFYDWNLLVVWQGPPSGLDSAKPREIFVPVKQSPQAFSRWLRGDLLWEFLVYGEDADVSITDVAVGEEEPRTYKWLMKKEGGQWKIGLIIGEM